eukprot:2426723-Amphidinium_carterae.2
MSWIGHESVKHVQLLCDPCAQRGSLNEQEEIPEVRSRYVHASKKGFILVTSPCNQHVLAGSQVRTFPEFQDLDLLAVDSKHPHQIAVT